MKRRIRSLGSFVHLTRGFLTLAAVAILVVLWQPICDAHEIDAGDSCCASMVDAAPAVAVPAISVAGQSAPAVAIAQAPAQRPAAERILAAVPRGHPPACLAYHARSTRNLN
jgi:hypothetical protein